MFYFLNIQTFLINAILVLYTERVNINYSC